MAAFPKYYLLCVRNVDDEERHLMTVGNDRQIIESTFCELSMMVDTLVGLWPSMIAYWSSEPGKFTLEAEICRDFPKKRKAELFETIREWRDKQDGGLEPLAEMPEPNPTGKPS